MKYFLIGIKGAGMSSLACILYDLGNLVLGSDQNTGYSFTLEKLMSRNIEIFPHNKDNIKEDYIIIKSPAIKDDNEEVVRARKLGLQIYDYPKFVGKFTKDYNLIAISGCHGKTTTTSLLSHIFKNTIGCNFIVGDGTGESDKNSNLFILEACEYRRNFLNYYPNTTIITNIELDHVDYYKDIEDIKDAYQSLINQTKKLVIACGDDLNIRDLKFRQVLFYGFNSNNDYFITNIKQKDNGMSFDLYYLDNLLDNFYIPFYGEHMILNAVASIIVLLEHKISISLIKDNLLTFMGAKRRFDEYIYDDVVMIDDYAHHPTEIKMTIKAAKDKYPNKKLIAVYEPHTYSRTSILKNEIIESLKLADKVYVMDIYSAREKSIDFPNITSKIIIDNIDNADAISIDTIDKIMNEKDVVILFMSAKNDMMRLKYDEIKKMEVDLNG